MKTVCIAGSLALLSLGLTLARGGEKTDSTLPSRVARCMQGVTLSKDQQAPFRALNREFAAELAEARQRVAAHELAKWRLDAIESNWCQRIDALLTTGQKQARVVESLHVPIHIEFVETPLTDVIDYLVDYLVEFQQALPLRIDRCALLSTGQRPDMAVTANLRGLSLDSSLRLILRQVGLMHVIQRGTILITTEAEGRRLLQHGAVDPADFPSPPREAAAKRLAEALRKPVDVDFIETPLKDGRDYFEDLCHVPIQIDNRGLEAAGIAPDAPCTIKLQGVSLDAALKQVLGKLGLKHVIQDEVILITAAAPAKPRPDQPQPTMLPADDPESARLRWQAHLEELGVHCMKTNDGRGVRFWLDSVGAGDDVLALAWQFQELKLESLSIPYLSRITDRGLAPLRYATYLTDLVLRGEKITDNGVANLAGLTRIRTLSLGATDITDAGVKHLEKLAQLQTLSLFGTRVDGSGFAALPNMEHLKILDLGDTQASDANLKYRARFPNLEVLHLESTRIDGSGFAALPNMEHLKTLVLNGSQASDANLKYLARFPNLEVLHLESTRIDGSGFAALPNMEHLKTLVLNGSQASDANLKYLARFPNLATLRMKSTRIDGSGLEVVAGLRRLNELCLEQSRVTDAGLDHLRGAASVTCLSLQSTTITDAALPHLAALPNLHELLLNHARITDAGLVHLRALKNLMSLELMDTGITDAGLAALRDIPNLRSACLYRTGVSEKAMKQFYRDLQKRAEADRKKLEPKTKKTDESDPFGP